MQESAAEGNQRRRVIETALALVLVALLIAVTFRVLLPFAGVINQHGRHLLFRYVVIETRRSPKHRLMSPIYGDGSKNA